MPTAPDHAATPRAVQPASPSARAPSKRRISAHPARACSRKIRRLVSVVAVAAAFQETLAVAAPLECSDRISIEGALTDRWNEPVSRLCRDFAVMKDVSPDARLDITPDGDDLLIHASFGNDHGAVRRVRSPEDLFTVVEALTVVIPDDHPKVAPTPVKPAEKRVSPRATATKPSAPRPVTPMGVELGVALEGRMSGSPLYVSLGGSLYAGLRPGPWLFALAARWQPSEVPASTPRAEFEMDSLGAGFVVARRLVQVPSFELDAGASVLMLVDTQSVESRTPDEVGSAADARFGLLIRALVGSKGLRFAPSIDADIAPSRVRHAVHLLPDLPALPSWSIAVGLGVSWVNP